MVSNGGLLVPAEVWDMVEHYIRPSPIVYTRLSRISRSAKASFTSNKQRKYIVPGVCHRGYAVFVDLVGKLSSKAKDELRKTWICAEKVSGHTNYYMSSEVRCLYTSNIVETRLQLTWAIIACHREGPTHQYYNNWNSRENIPTYTRRSVAL